MKKLFAAACLALVVSASAETGASPHVYGNGVKIALKISNDLFETLDSKRQKNISPEVLQMETAQAPVITPIENTDDNNRAIRQVSISIGFIDLMNHIAHAKAIDHIQPGYFQQYILNLARDTGSDAAPPEPPNMVDPRFWTDDVMNDQMTFFNQMLGMTIAVNLAHHYMGHYTKYSSQMLAGKLVPINNLIAPPEWNAGIKAAVLNSLDCALGIEGAKALFDAIDKMPRRPAWTAFIVPESADLKKLNEQLAKWEYQYFHGGLK